ncbi:hypothetical protein [Methylobacterium sp. WL103]|uniref:hypothetical protein n=1 Tax=Methylobacterium sp. WL103 TaxID=2603891 RepID=UPI00164FD340|nr:hypothetical protein [Methylobacterium sp. WL103]
MASIAEVAATMRDVVTPGMKPKEIRAAIREKHPEASKKEIVRAAFYALAEAPAGALADLHGFALSERGATIRFRRVRARSASVSGRGAAPSVGWAYMVGSFRRGRMGARCRG